jgi:hypothetical protein
MVVCGKKCRFWHFGVVKIQLYHGFKTVIEVCKTKFVLFRQDKVSKQRAVNRFLHYFPHLLQHLSAHVPENQQEFIVFCNRIESVHKRGP